MRQFHPPLRVRELIVATTDQLLASAPPGEDAYVDSLEDLRLTEQFNAPEYAGMERAV
jgi:hypothetical protein